MKKILIVEDQRLHREYMESIVRNSGRYELVPSVTAADLAAEICRKTRIDLILMDIAVNGSMDGIEAAGYIKKLFPAVKIVIVTSMLDEMCLIRAKDAGVDSMWYKDVSGEELLDVIDSAMSDDRIFPASSPEVTVGNCNSGDFTKTENSILREIVNGLSNKQIADKLGTSENTVNWHVKNLLSKTGLSNRTMLAISAVRGNLFIAENREEPPKEVK